MKKRWTREEINGMIVDYVLYLRRGAKSTVAGIETYVDGEKFHENDGILLIEIPEYIERCKRRFRLFSEIVPKERLKQIGHYSFDGIIAESAVSNPLIREACETLLQEEGIKMDPIVKYGPTTPTSWTFDYTVEFASGEKHRIMHDRGLQFDCQWDSARFLNMVYHVEKIRAIVQEMLQNPGPWDLHGNRR